MKKNILRNAKIATLFNSFKINDNLFVLFPSRFLIGETASKNMYMLDYCTAEIYENSELITYSAESGLCCFSNVKSLYKLFDEYNTSDIKKILKKEIEYLQTNTFFFNPNEEMPIIKTLHKEKFVEEYGLEIDYMLSNESIQYFVNGEYTFEFLENDEEMYDVINEDKQLESIKLENIKKVYENIKENVISQDRAIKKILTAIYKNNIIEDSRMKTNVLLYGSSGVGKTEILRQIQRVTNLPIIIEDINTYTVAGYKGNDVENLLSKLYIASNYNIHLAERGILCLDEIDKKVSTDSENSISFEGVLNSLLKIIEGGKFEFCIDGNEIIEFDTSHLTIIASGAFQQLKSRITRKNTKIGFGNNVEELKISEFTTEDFVNYGLPREFMGRFSSIVKLNDLSKDDLKTILLNSNISSLKINMETLKKLNVDVCLPEVLIDKIIEKAYNENVGARALNRIVNELFEEALFDIFSNEEDDFKTLKFDETSIEDNKKYKILRKKFN